MTDALKKVLEETTLSDSAKAAISEAWETKLQEAREDLAASLRDEFSVKYEKDKSEIVEAIDLMVRDAIKGKVTELEESKKLAINEAVNAKTKLAETVTAFDAFAKKQLAKEVAEFRDDRIKTAAKVSEVDKFVNETLTKELVGIHEDRRKLVEDRVELHINAKKDMAKTKKRLVNEMTSLCHSFIRKHLTEEMTQLKGELIEAKKKHFGMKMFEAFAAEFGSSFFNERKEMKKLLDVISQQNKKIEEAKKESVKKDSMIAESINQRRIIEDRFTRTKTLNELCGSLAGSKRKLMEELLEKVPTNKLTENFNAYLQSVIKNENGKTLTESRTNLKEVTGNKENLMSKAIKENAAGEVANDVLGSFHKMQNYSSTKGTI